MPIAVVCRGCHARLNAPDSAAGKRVKCPKCGAALTVPAPAADDDFEVVDDEPTPPKRRPVADDEDDDRPVRKRSRRDEEDDEEEDDRPRPKKKKKGKKAAPKSNLPLVLGIGGGVLVLAVVGVILAFALGGKKDDAAKATGGGVNTPAGGAANQLKGPPPGWQEFTQPEFTAYFLAGNAPQDLSAQAQVGLRQTPGTTVKLFVQEDKAKDSGCMVMVTGFPPNVAANLTADPNKVYDEAAARVSKLQPGTTIRSQKPTATAGHDGKQYELKSEKDVSFMRVFLAQQRLYVLMAGGPNATENDPQVKTFFDNFQPK